MWAVISYTCERADKAKFRRVVDDSGKTKVYEDEAEAQVVADSLKEPGVWATIVPVVEEKEVEKGVV